MVNVAIGLGSNLGDSLAYLQAACSELERILIEPLTSQLYLTPPVGYSDQPSYLNAVMVGLTEHSADDLLQLVKQIERSVGRTRFVSGRAREIDLDLLLHGTTTVVGLELHVPHPRMHERWFVLQPLCDLWPDAVHPVLQRPVLHLLNELARPVGAVRVAFDQQTPR